MTVTERAIKVNCYCSLVSSNLNWKWFKLFSYKMEFRSQSYCISSCQPQPVTQNVCAHVNACACCNSYDVSKLLLLTYSINRRQFRSCRRMWYICISSCQPQPVTQNVRAHVNACACCNSYDVSKLLLWTYSINRRQFRSCWRMCYMYSFIH